MIEIIKKIPKNNTVNVAFSGGVDSLALALYFKNKGFTTKLLHFNHCSEHSDKFETFCVNIANKLNLPIIVGNNNKEKSKKQSLEDFWRQCRYDFLFENCENNGYIVTGHHLNDAVETWIWSSLNGEGKLIQEHKVLKNCTKTCNIIRPFLLNKKQKLEEYVNYHNIESIYDDSNSDNKYTRNYIRNVMMEHVKFVNPGIEKVIYKKYKYKKQ